MPSYNFIQKILGMEGSVWTESSVPRCDALNNWSDSFFQFVVQFKFLEISSNF
jgi:hypothetical protein